jgi:hypothetical protein
MARPRDHAAEAEGHRDSVEAAARALESQDPSAWNAPIAPGKWSPAEIAQHLALSYAPAIAELEGGRGYAIRLAAWQRFFARTFVVPRILAGKFPERAPAPRESRPTGGAATPAEGARLLRESAEKFAHRLAEARAAGPVRVTHPYFGRLDAPVILRILSVHARHHLAQLPVRPADLGRVGYSAPVNTRRETT